jgi:hypothetical protein
MVAILPHRSTLSLYRGLKLDPDQGQQVISHMLKL